MPPNYLDFSRDRSLQKLEEVYKAVTSETNVDRSEIDSAREVTECFVHSSFDFFEGRRVIDRKIGRVFVVPLRSNRHDENYATESTPMAPILDPVKFGVSSDIRMRTIYGMPPMVLDTYTKSQNDDEAGVLVLAPLYSEMSSDIMPDKHNVAQRQKLLEVGGKVLAETARFSHHTLGADVVGLGAILPRLTNYGQALRSIPGMENLVTTTGHGGTVYMVIATALKVIAETSIDTGGKLGVIGGAGSIGWSSIVAAGEMLGDHHIYTFDANAEQQRRLVGSYGDSAKIDIVESAADVLRTTNIIVTAVTRPIDLDHGDFQGLDLTGKVIIDDSQPGCFDADQVEARGGRLSGWWAKIAAAVVS